MDASWINKDYRLVDKRDDLGKALGYYRSETKTMPIVVDGKKAYGIVDARRILGRGIRRTTKIDKVAQPVPCVTADVEIDALVEVFTSTLAPALPVCAPDHIKVLGYVDAATALDGISGTLTIDQAPVATLDPENTINDAIHAFQEANTVVLPVVDAGYVSGIVERKDLVRLAELEATNIGRQDLSGKQVDLRDQSIESILVGGGNEIPIDAGLNIIRQSIQEEGYVILTAGRKYAGYLDAGRLMRLMTTKDEVLYGTATPHYRRHSNL